LKSAHIQQFASFEGSSEVASTNTSSATITDKLEGLVDILLESDHPYAQQVLIPTFARLGQKSRLLGARLVDTWTKHATGNGIVDNVFAIVLGYLVLAVLLAIYLNILTIGSMRSAGKAVRQTVRNQLLIAKVI
jgi:E3 ubiquitin-protein ligase MARCH6